MAPLFFMEWNPIKKRQKLQIVIRKNATSVRHTFCNAAIDVLNMSFIKFISHKKSRNNKLSSWNSASLFFFAPNKTTCWQTDLAERYDSKFLETPNFSDLNDQPNMCLWTKVNWSSYVLVISWKVLCLQWQDWNENKWPKLTGIGRGRLQIVCGAFKNKIRIKGCGINKQLRSPKTLTQDRRTQTLAYGKGVKGNHVLMRCY